MDKTFELWVEIIEESGYDSAMKGISLNKNQRPENMGEVALKLSDKDFGHNKFMEQIILWILVRAPRYFWQEADTFRLSSKSSQSTMHTILKNKLTRLNSELGDIEGIDIEYLNTLLSNGELVKLKRKLPEGFMQTRMWMMSYKTMRNLIIQRRSHVLPHWQYFIQEILKQVKHPELLP
jgi:hypothetical protein